MLGLPGQDPGFSNRRGATSHTHMWAWLRFVLQHYTASPTAIIHDDYRTTGSQVGFESQISKGGGGGGGALDPTLHEQQQSCGGVRVSQATTNAIVLLP